MAGERNLALLILLGLGAPCQAARSELPRPSTAPAMGAPPIQVPAPPPKLDLAGAIRAAASISSPWTDQLPVAPPQAPSRPGEYQRGGGKVKDSLLGLEDPHQADTRAWVKGETRTTRAYLNTISQRHDIRRRLAELSKVDEYGMPSKRGEHYFYTKRGAGQEGRSLYIADKLYGPARVLIDPKEFNKEGTAAIAGLSFSPNAKLVAYSIRRDGSDWAEWRVRNVATGRDLPDRLHWTFAGKPVSWSPKGDGFYYERYAAAKTGEKYTGVKRSTGTFFHALGDGQAEDKRFGYGSVSFADGGRLLLLDQGNTLYQQDSRDPKRAWTKLVEVKSSSSSFELVGRVGRRSYLLTDVNAPRKRLVAVDGGKPSPKDWVEILPQSNEVLEEAALVDERIIAVWNNPSGDRAMIYGLDGKPQREVKLPGAGSVSGFRKWRDGFALYSFSSYLQPGTVYRYNFETGESTAFHPAKPDFDPSRYVVEQVFYPSKDGTRIPMDLVHRKDLKRDASNPTYLYGYGGFGVTLEPGFEAEEIEWMDLGGIYAVAHLRGGGEYGEEWHDAGRLKQKQNVFDDFIAAAEWLIHEKYTRPDKLAIGGGSNGGLLVGAVMTQRPELFGAALPSVGVMDMLRFDKFTVGAGWIPDYGNPDSKADFKNMSKYSPYHNVRPKTDYPATMVMTSDHDDRVVPSHSYKFGAALQAAQGGEDPILIRTQRDAGHGGSVSWNQWLSSETDRLSFLVRSLGVKELQPGAGR